MPTFLPVVFTFDSATQVGPSTVSARFSYQPNAGTAGYSLSGSNGETRTVTSCVPGVDFGEVIVTASAPFTAATWTLTCSASVTAGSGPAVPLTPTSHTFSVIAGPAPYLPFQGVNPDAAVFLRSVIPMSMSGTAWSALIAALATGSEQPAWDNAPNVFDALFLSSALGYYLNRRAADVGLERPSDVPMDDASWRRLVIAVTADKLTIKSIMDVLTIFYGVESTHAHILSDVEPYLLNDGDTLSVTFDGLDTPSVVFHTADFTNIAQATAEEVVGVLTRAFLAQGMTHFARVERDPVTGSNSVSIYTGTAGLRGSVIAGAGAAQATLALPTTLASLLGQMRASYVKILAPQSIEVVFPATTDVVTRGLNTGAYLSHWMGAWSISWLYQTGDVVVDDGFFYVAAVPNSGIIPGFTADWVSVPDMPTWNSPYLSEGIDKGLAVTETSTTLTSAVMKDHQYALLNVASSATFPDSAGYLVLGYGWDYRSAPVPYLGRAGATGLALDPTFSFPADVPAGADVRLLNGLAAPTPSKGQFWLTASPAGRIAAMSFVDFITAAGYNLKKTVIYPSDVGLGNEGYPTSGQPKLSDIVQVFGGNDLDVEIPVLRQEN